ncbi:hypothetical protein PR048_015663 [Dryococelus australis]|uniref:Uncharacterized protein n=1 Tax=Dryococelus australis TaxID=614101 RepID=A0ABQ9HIL9_9NEOP|nr:hypothetical protein PR048_015663 [Dryococelus australis]
MVGGEQANRSATVAPPKHIITVLRRNCFLVILEYFKMVFLMAVKSAHFRMKAYVAALRRKRTAGLYKINKGGQENHYSTAYSCEPNHEFCAWRNYALLLSGIEFIPMRSWDRTIFLNLRPAMGKRGILIDKESIPRENQNFERKKGNSRWWRSALSSYPRSPCPRLIISYFSPSPLHPSSHVLFRQPAGDCRLYMTQASYALTPDRHSEPADFCGPSPTDTLARPPHLIVHAPPSPKSSVPIASPTTPGRLLMELPQSSITAFHLHMVLRAIDVLLPLCEPGTSVSNPTQKAVGTPTSFSQLDPWRRTPGWSSRRLRCRQSILQSQEQRSLPPSAWKRPLVLKLLLQPRVHQEWARLWLSYGQLLFCQTSANSSSRSGPPVVDLWATFGLPDISRQYIQKWPAYVTNILENFIMGKREIPPENVTTSAIFQHDCNVRKSGSDPAGNRTRFALLGGERFSRNNIAAVMNESCQTMPLWSTGFLGELKFLPPLLSGAAPYSPRFILIGSQYLVVKRRPNLFTHSCLGIFSCAHGPI